VFTICKHRCSSACLGIDELDGEFHQGRVFTICKTFGCSAAWTGDPLGMTHTIPSIWLQRYVGGRRSLLHPSQVRLSSRQAGKSHSCA